MAPRTLRNEPKPADLTLAVGAAAVSVRRMVKAHVDGGLGESAATKIRIEGQSDGPSSKIPRETLLLVSSNGDLSKPPGSLSAAKRLGPLVVKFHATSSPI